MAAAQSRTDLSREPEANDAPSGEKATLDTQSVWPSSTWGAAGPQGEGGGHVRMGRRGERRDWTKEVGGSEGQEGAFQYELATTRGIN